jgi:inhibitor of cysteine peptidase
MRVGAPARRGAGALLAAAAALLAASSATAQARTVTVTEAFDGGVLTLADGDQLVVRLGGDAGSGDSWVPAFNDASLLQPVGPPAGEAAPGAGGARVFRFQASGTRGSASLGFAWAKPSAAEQAPGRLFRLLAVFGQTVHPRHHKVRDTDGGSRLYLTEGDTLIVRLPATPSTGYGWSVERSSPILKPQGDPKWEPAPSGQPGAEGAQVLEFAVGGPGSAWLELGYKRPFEKGSRPAKTWSVFVASAGLGR